MFKAKNMLLPINFKKFFILKYDGNNRRKSEFKRIFVRTTLKQMCIKLLINLKNFIKKKFLKSLRVNDA